MNSMAKLLRIKTFRLILGIMLSITFGVGCSNNGSPETTTINRTTTTSNELEAMNKTQTVTLQPTQGETSGGEAEIPETGAIIKTPTNSIVLPEEGQIPPSEILAEIRWFDAGAGGRGSYGSCNNEMKGSIENIQVFQEAVYWNEREFFLEGEDIMICGRGFQPQTNVTWTLETPDDKTITEKSIADSDGISEFLLDYSYFYGHYEIHAESEEDIYHKQFDIIETNSPKAWVNGQLIPGQPITVYYAGFQPNAEISTTWYTQILWDIGQYLTHWKSKTDETGRASETIFTHSEFCFPRLSILAVQSHSFTRKTWVLPGFRLDLPATAVTSINIDSACESSVIEQMSSMNNQLTANSSRLLNQTNMGNINDGEIRRGHLESPFDAHNWVYEANAGQPFTIQSIFPDDVYPIARISIIDPSEKLTFECSDAVYGCSEIIEFTPEISGVHTIRLDVFNSDIFNEGNIEYSISVSSSP